MLKLYDYFDTIRQSYKEDSFFKSDQLFFANDIFDLLDIKDETQQKSAITRAFQSCVSSSVPLNSNFRPVYRFGDNGLIADWQLSALACYLIIINCDPHYKQVAKAQLFFAIKGSKI